MQKSKAKILIVEDDTAILEGVSDVLVYHGYDVTAIEDGTKGLETALSEIFDLIILDVMLPGIDGFSICRETRKKKANQAIIMLTAKGSEDDIVTGFKAGADDYISKPFSIRELMVRVEALLRRAGKGPANEKVELAGAVFDSSTLTMSLDSRSQELTRREMDIIFYLHRNQPRIVSKKELLKKVWLYSNPEIETRTVDIHIQKLRKKLSGMLGEDAELIKTVRGEGFRLAETA